MKRAASIGNFHTYQITTIYLPGAAIIPVTIILWLLEPLWAAVFFVICLAWMILGLSFRSRVAAASGLREDYE